MADCTRCGKPRAQRKWARKCEECEKLGDEKKRIVCKDCKEECDEAALGLCFACYVYRRRTGHPRARGTKPRRQGAGAVTDLICKHCQKTFRASYKRLFCSRECGYTHRGRPMLNIKCKQCKKIFAKRSGTFCSRECFQGWAKRMYTADAAK